MKNIFLKTYLIIFILIPSLAFSWSILEDEGVTKSGIEVLGGGYSKGSHVRLEIYNGSSKETKSFEVRIYPSCDKKNSRVISVDKKIKPNNEGNIYVYTSTKELCYVGVDEVKFKGWFN